jgi:hypothetical protein
VGRPVLVVCAAAALAGFGAGSTSAAPASCKAGVTTYGGASARVFCGPAKATVHYGSTVLKLSDGDCEKTSKYFNVNIGTVVLGTSKKPKPDYFGLVVGQYLGSGKPAPHDGTYPGGAVGIEYGGKGYLVRGDTVKVTLAGNRSRGTFTGDSLFVSPPVKVTGSFSC